MRRLVALLLLVCSTAVAGDWQHIAGNRYTDGVSEWQVTSDCCGGYKYRNVGPYNAVPYSRGNGKYDKVLDLLRDREDREDFRALLDTLGIKGRGTQYTSYGTQSSGYSVLQQGYVPGLVQSGQTLYGTASYQAGIPIDVTGLIHEAQRLADRTLTVATSANSGANQLVSQAVEGNSKAAQISASADVAAAAITAANPVQTETKVWQTQPAQQPAGQTSTEAIRYSSTRAASTDGALALFTCAQCHSGAAPKANLNLSLSSIRNLSPDQRTDLAARINERVNLPPTDPKHMPKARGDLPENAKRGLLELILQDSPSNAVAPPQQPYRDDRPPAPPDSPPVPPQALQPQPNQGAQQKPIGRILNQFVQMLGQK